MADGGQSGIGFNPTKVRLEGRYTVQCPDCGELQPHKGSSGSVAILALRHDQVAPTPQRFVWKTPPDDIDEFHDLLQPHKGSSGSSRPRPSSSIFATSFNPTKVRLEGASMISPPCSSTLQPHKGSSGSAGEQLPVVDRRQLQPHKGSSGSTRGSRRRRTRSSFNPTKVRLEGRETDDEGVRLVLQPHKGSSGSVAAK